MKAALYRHDLPRYLAARAVHDAVPGLWSPRLAPIGLVDRPAPEPTRPGWVRVGVRLSGICGSDIHLLTGADSLYLEPEATYPFTPGHELTGVVEAMAPGVGPAAMAPGAGPAAMAPGAGLAAGERVAVWAPIGCVARGLEPACPDCAAGFDGLCRRRDEGWPGRGLSIGFNRDTGGGWAGSCLAHASQLWPLPGAVADRQAVLLDPAATALAALLRSEGPAPARTLLVGGGTIGLLAARLARAFARPGSYEILVRHRFQAERAAGRGVPVHLVGGEADFRDWAAGQGIHSRRVTGYGHVFRGVYDRVIDTAGTASSFAWSLAAVRPGGEVVIVSGPARPANFDPTPLWYREIRLRGIYVYGPVPWEGRPEHPYRVLLPAIADGRLALDDLVTHQFPLARLFDALATAAGRARSAAIKVVLHPGDAPDVGAP